MAPVAALARQADGESRQPSSSRRVRSFVDFGALPDGATSVAALRSAINAAWLSALANGHDLYHPGGVYDIGDASFPWRQDAGVAGLLDCRNVTIFGNGPNSVFQTTSDDGADVFQLRAVRNLHFRNLCLKAVLNGDRGSGSNGVSVTGGYDNITLLDIWCEALPAVAKADHLDGGKALTIQCDRAADQTGFLKARMFARNCAFGFGLDANLATQARAKTAVDIDLVAEDCFAAVVVSALPSGVAVPSGTDIGLSIKVQSINCQKDLWLARAHGLTIDCRVITSKPAGDRRRGPSGEPWLAGEGRVEALVGAYVRNTRITLSGDKGECDHKLRIGSAAAGAAETYGTTSASEIVVDLAGTAAKGAIVLEDDHGPALTHSILVISAVTGDIPAALQSPAADNLIVHGAQAHLCNPTVAGVLTLSDGAGRGLAGEMRTTNGTIDLRRASSTARSTPDQLIATFSGDGGRVVAGIRVDGAPLSASILRNARPDGDIVAVRPEYGSDNQLVGYVPVYAGYKRAR
ncbi:hypothetical protein ASG29_14380 [Sphingomonas sp. Leaf412]|nr:hypothetical protein ASG29_14380 [Sphingomonas sp. Leaf412]